VWAPIASLLVVIALLGAAALWLPANSTARRFALVMWGAVPTAVAIWQYCYVRVEKHRLFVDRTLFWLMNRESTWSLTAEFDVDDVELRFTEASAALLQLNGSRKLSGGQKAEVWQINGTTVRLAADVASDPLRDTGVLTIEFPPAPRQFRVWPRVINETVDAVVSVVQDRLPAGKKKFVARVGFPGENPYFGLFISNVPLTTVKKFDIEIAEVTMSDTASVLVHKDRVDLVTSSMSSTRQLSLRYLALRSMEAA